jgi:hypothetical protein
MTGLSLAKIKLYEKPRPTGPSPSGFKAFAVGTHDEDGEILTVTTKNTLSNDELNDEMPFAPRWMHEKLLGYR